MTAYSCSSRAPFTCFVFVSSLIFGGCSCDGSVEQIGEDGGADGSMLDSGGFDGGGGDGSTGNDGGPGDGGMDAQLDAAADPCASVSCNPGQRCEVQDGGGLCIDNECSDLSCGVTERCEPHPLGGNTCVDISCSSDVQCAASEYCNGIICVDDICTPNATRCDGSSVVSCASNGGSESTLFGCGGAAYFTSTCIDDGLGGAGCSCEGDWDCPAFTVCTVGRCTGTGVAPTCLLPPVPFSSVPPTEEVHWGGESRTNDDAFDGTPARNPAPWNDYSHMLMTPVVANLDDDNGDGLINELDFPEVIFTTHQGNNPWGNGVLRAIHGGGPNKGADYFARCADKLWTRAAPTSDTCTGSEPDADAGAPVAVGDLDGDGVPEIVYMRDNNTFRILDNTGALIYTLDTAWNQTEVGETAAIANLDFAGFPEIIVGETVYVLGEDSGNNLIVTHILDGGESSGQNEISKMACPADLDSTHAGLEIVAGASLYRMPDTLPSCGTPPCVGTLTLVWHAEDIPGQDPRLSGDGFCAVADVWGANPAAAPGPGNPLDGVPEIVLIDDGDLTILDPNGTIIDDRDLGGGARGGAPNVDDFDGDGFMEIATALQDFYAVVDLQESTGTGGSCPDWPDVIARVDSTAPPHNPNPARNPGGACTSNSQCDADAVCNTTLGQCTCLHNGWRRDSDDDSSRATSSSVFDFNGDGAAEVLYNDECDFRVYDGANGEVLFSAVSRSRTGIENPVVADVDNDGNAEVVVGMNTATGNRCDEDGANPIGPNGIRIWGDSTDTWVSARRIWNQQSYHVTNVLEGGGLPLHEPESWLTFAGRSYNTYRSQPRSFGIAPDLTVVDIGVSSPDAQCGSLSDNIDISYEIRNQGDLRVGPGVVVQFFGTWNGTEEQLLDSVGGNLEDTLTVTLEPGASTFLSINYDRTYNSMPTLPASIRVVVDPTSSSNPAGAERECDEANNELSRNVDPGMAAADLRISVGLTSLSCPMVNVPVTIINDGTAPAQDILVRLFAGDPAAGGTVIHEETVAGPVAPDSSTSVTMTINPFPLGRTITVYGFVDPDDSIMECNNANNVDAADNTAFCVDLI